MFEEDDVVNTCYRYLNSENVKIVPESNNKLLSLCCYLLCSNNFNPLKLRLF